MHYACLAKLQGLCTQHLDISESGSSNYGVGFWNLIGIEYLDLPRYFLRFST